MVIGYYVDLRGQVRDVANQRGNFVDLVFRIQIVVSCVAAGVKAEKLWGPLGGRFDIRGRTIFNVADKNPTGLEISGGLILSWGPK